MEFLKALQLSKKEELKQSRELFILSNFEMSQFEIFLKAYANILGFSLKINNSGFNNLNHSLLNSEIQADYQIIFLTVEDVFPALSYRNQTSWDQNAIQALVKNKKQTTTQFVDLIESYAVKMQGSKILLIPPFLPPPPLSKEAPNALGDFVNLANEIQDELKRHLAPAGNIFILDPVRTLTHLSTNQIQDLNSLFHKGYPYSVPATDALASECVKLILDFPARSKKLVITDLDQVVWKGVIGEDGIDSISSHLDKETYVFYQYQSFLKLLRSEGALIAVASKNNPKDVEELFTNPKHLKKTGVILRKEDFSAFECAWDNKSKQVERICSKLNLLPQDAVVIDDNDYELTEIQAAFPGITCIRFPRKADELDIFLREIRAYFAKSKLTEEDRTRSVLYARKNASEEFRSQFKNTEEYLKSLQMKVKISQVASDDERAFQLYNKTNQFNLTGERMDRAQWEKFLSAKNHFGYKLELIDIFGTHGVVSVCLLETMNDKLFIHNMVLSCRVFNRTAETAFLEWIIRQFGSCNLIAGQVKETAKNEPCREFYLNHNFKNSNDGVFEAKTPFNLPRHYIAFEKMTVSHAKLANKELVQVRTIRPSDEADVIRFCSQIFNLDESHFQKTWQWLFHENPHLKETDEIGYVLDVNGKVVGFSGIVPQIFVSEGEQFTFLFASCYCVLPEYKLQGIRLARYFLAKGQSFKITNSANEKTAEIYRYLGAKEEGNRPHHFKVIKLEGVLRTISSPWREIASLFVPILNWIITLGRKRKLQFAFSIQKDIDHSFNKLWTELQSLFPLVSRRDEAYLKWRYFSHPEKPYSFYSIRNQNQELAGYVVYSVRRTKKNLTLLNVVDIFCDFSNKNLMRDVISFLENEAWRQNIDILFANSIQSQNTINFPGFFRKKSEKRTVFKNDTGFNLDILNESSKWHLSTSDGDADMAMWPVRQDL